jgi:hypothetical protein
MRGISEKISFLLSSQVNLEKIVSLAIPKIRNSFLLRIEVHDSHASVIDHYHHVCPPSHKKSRRCAAKCRVFGSFQNLAYLEKPKGMEKVVI